MAELGRQLRDDFPQAAGRPEPSPPCESREGGSEKTIASPGGAPADAARAHGRGFDRRVAMTEESAAAIFAYDETRQLVYCNRAALKLCGAEDVDALRASDFPRVKRLGSASGLSLSIYLSRSGFTEEVVLEVKPAKLLPCLITGSELRGENGEPDLRYASILDVTEMHAFKTRLKDKHDALAVAKEQAELANRSKTEFLANMSHELRTPLNAIIGFSEVIMGETFGPLGSERYREYLRNIAESGTHLLGIINDILDMSKVESGEQKLHEAHIDIREIARSVLNLVRERAEKAGIECVADFPDDMPPMRADQRKLKQILINLLSNAVKFTPEGGRVTLKALCGQSSGHVFQVIDTGIGIAPEDIPKAMTPFRQVDSALNRKFEGTGLGLPLSKSLVELHDGSLDLESQVGVGTTVTVRFPADRIAPLAKARQMPSAPVKKAS